MSEVDNRAQGKSFSFYKEDLEKVEKYAKDTERTVSEALRYIINTFLDTEYRSIKKDAIFFIVYPSLFCIFFLFGSFSTENLINILVQKGYYFDELYLLNRIFNIMGFGALSYLVANIYVLYRKRKGKE